MVVPPKNITRSLNSVTFCNILALSINPRGFNFWEGQGFVVCDPGATNGLKGHYTTDGETKISNTFPTEGIGKNLKNRFKQITRKALRKSKSLHKKKK